MWKDVPGYPGIQAHEDGRIRVMARTLRHKNRYGYCTKHYTTRELTVGIKGSNYPRVTIPDLRDEAPRYQRAVHVHILVATAHCKRKPGQGIVRHKDGDKFNWRADNLAWGTYEDNEKDKRLHGRNLSGARHHQAKLTAEDVAYIKSVHKAKTKQYGSIALAREFGVHRTTIENIVSGRTW